MSKYEALGRYLRNQNIETVTMTFREIEKVTGTKLPNSKQYPAWWSNNTMNNVMTRVWLEAGYRTEQVDITGEKLVFHRTATPRQGMQENSRMFDPAPKDAAQAVHPIIGAMKGTFTIEPGWDLTKPALDQQELDEIASAIEKTADLIDEGLRAR